MITHKEAMERLKNYKIYATNQVIVPNLLYELDELIELIDNEMWHDYSKEKPTKDGIYLFKMKHCRTGYCINQYLVVNKLLVYDGFDIEDIIAWRELPKYEREVKEMDKEIIKFTKDEWLKKGKELFGDNYENWKFKCPHCGNIASGKEFKDAGAKLDDIYTNCIGRFVKNKGCDWAAYGLFDICKVHVDGAPVFEFADNETT